MKYCRDCLFWLPNRPEFRIPNAGLCLCPKINAMTLGELGCDNHVSADSVEANVPNHLPNGIAMTNDKPVEGPVEIMICSYAAPTLRVSGKVVSDLDWLIYAVRSIRKFCTGFQSVTIVHPNHEREQFERALSAYDVRLRGFNDIPGKGFIQHEIMLARADELVPDGTKYVLLTDSDYVFNMPTTPADYFKDAKPYYLIRSWDSLTTEDPRRPGTKCIQDNLMWKAPTDAQVGFDTKWFGMCQNCCALPVYFFKHYRDHVAAVQGKPFDEWMLEGKNSHPTNRMDWTAFGSFAERLMHNHFTWIDVVNESYPQDRRLPFWSHGGITPEIKQQLEELLR